MILVFLSTWSARDDLIIFKHHSFSHVPAAADDRLVAALMVLAVGQKPRSPFWVGHPTYFCFFFSLFQNANMGDSLVNRGFDS